MDRQPRRRARQIVTIQDVAAHAGVSPMTVSRVVNNEPNVKAATRERVNAAIKALNYAPNQAARSLASSAVLRIGLLYSNPSAAYLSEFLVGALDEASRTGHHLMLEKSSGGSQGERASLRRLLDGGADGVVLPPPLCDSNALLSELREAGIPSVSVATGRPAGDDLSVRIDDYKAAYAMTRHLITLGHRRIGFIKGHPNQTASRLRYQGFVAAMLDHDLPCPPGSIEQGYFDYRSGIAAAEQLLAADPVPTAIFASNDDMAAAALAVAHRHGLSVPGDLSVAGFDDTPIATTIWPALTTVRQPIAAMARAAIDLLARDIKQARAGGARESTQQFLKFALIKRESTTPPGEGASGSR